MTSELRSFEQFQSSLRCFDYLDGTGITGASDIDLLIERKGRFLLVEAKPRQGPNVLIPLGQFIALKNLSKLEQFTVLVVGEDEDAKEDAILPRYAVLHIRPNTRQHFEGFRNNQRCAGFYTDGSFTHVTLDGLKQMLKVWWSNDEEA